MLALYDTAQRKLRPIETRDPGKFGMYACGPTVYDHPHLGHGRKELVYDILRRYLEWTGLEVIHVENVTDIEDKIIARAKEEEKSESEVTGFWENVWWTQMERLGILRPHYTPHATEYLHQMIDLIERLINNGSAYKTSDGVYFDVAKLDGYGLLANQSLDSLKAGARVEVNEDKRSPVDFALWKLVDEDGTLSWESPFGRGRPGWHTECVVMSLDLLGENFDLHGGGLDLTFPHHENERAQAIADGKTFANYWVHNGFVEVDGEKMSKSLNNFKTLTDLLDRYDPRAFRLLILQSHYRSPMNVTPELMDAATKGIERIDEFARRAIQLDGAPIKAEFDSFTATMDNDLDTPNAVANLFELLRKGNVAIDAGEKDRAGDLAVTVLELFGVLGVNAVVAEDEFDSELSDLITARDEARAAKDWAKSDEIRDQLIEKGWVVEDTPYGTQVHR